MKSCADGTCSLRLQAAANSKSTPPTLMAPANRECRIGCIPFLWPSVGATNPPIEEVDPTIVFDRAFDSEQSVGPDFDQQPLAFINPEMGCALLDRIRCGWQIQIALRKNKTISTGLVDLGSFQFFRSDGGATKHPIMEVVPRLISMQHLAANKRWRPISTNGTPRLSTQKWDAPCWAGFGAVGKFKWPCGRTKTISTGLVDLGSFQFFRSDGGATKHPIEEVAPRLISMQHLAASRRWRPISTSGTSPFLYPR